MDRFPTPEAFRDYFKSNYGPTIAAYKNVSGDPEKTAALDHDLVELGRRNDVGGGAMDWDYLVLTAKRA